MEFRYYEIPQNEPLLARMGDMWIMEYGWQVDFLHFHNLLEIGYCYYGEGDMIFDDTVCRFGSGAITSIPANYIHTTNSDEGTLGSWEYLFIDVEDTINTLYKDNLTFAQEIIKSINKRAFLVWEEENETLGEIIKIIFREIREKKKFYLESVRGLVLPLLMEIARINEALPNKVNNRVTNVMQIGPALDYVSLFYYRDIKVCELAFSCHMSESYFRKIFEICMNMTPLEYTNMIRIQKACDLMKKSQDSMSMISQKVGFETQTTFNRNFKRFLGTTPYQWKNHPDNYEGKLLNFKISAQKGC